MSRAQVAVALMVTWVAVGLVVGIIMGRRGHHTSSRPGPIGARWAQSDLPPRAGGP
jgi:hypothetical protein